jgi:hypothetical protein
MIKDITVLHIFGEIQFINIIYNKPVSCGIHMIISDIFCFIDGQY